MKTIEHIQNPVLRDELEKLTGLIREICDPEMILLYGSHTDGFPLPTLGMYNLMVVLRPDNPVTDFRIRDHTYKRFPLEERTVPFSYYRLCSTRDINMLARESFFHYCVVRHGISLYDSGAVFLDDHPVFGMSKYLQNTLKAYEVWKELGEGFLRDSKNNLDSGCLRLSASHLSFSVGFLFRALETAYYGSSREYESHRVCLQTLRHCSPDLEEWYRHENEAIRKMLGFLRKVKDMSLSTKSLSYDQNHLERYYRDVERIRDIIHGDGNRLLEICRTYRSQISGKI